MFTQFRCSLHVLLIAGLASAAPNDWAEGTPGKEDGASRDFYNRIGSLEWKNKMGDWRDAKNVEQGQTPYVTATIKADQKGKPVEWDATALMMEWRDGKHPNQGFFLKGINGGTATFGSREQADATLRPQLILTGEKGEVVLTPTADTFLEQSTYRSQGDRDQLKVSIDAQRTLLRFELKQVPKITRAVLRLHLIGLTGSQATIGVFRCAQGHDVPAEEPLLGFAAKYPGDKGIEKDPAAIFATGFESEKWTEEWTQAAPLKALAIRDADADLKFEPLSGKALRSELAKGELTALNTLYKFQKQIGSEPEEIYFRYYLRLANDWNQTVQGGKMPGISGTYGVAGWGGRKSNGTNGWSARGSFALSAPEGNPLAGLHPIGTYCYHTDQKGNFGDGWIWNRGYRGFLEKNRWYCIEQHLKLNVPGEKNGMLQAWVDGRLAFEKTDIRFRQVDKLKIEQVWLNVYHGGTVPSPYDQHLYIDNVVIAKKYIGPMK